MLGFGLSERINQSLLSRPLPRRARRARVAASIGAPRGTHSRKTCIASLGRPFFYGRICLKYPCTPYAIEVLVGGEMVKNKNRVDSKIT